MRTKLVLVMAVGANLAAAASVAAVIAFEGIAPTGESLPTHDDYVTQANGAWVYSGEGRVVDGTAPGSGEHYPSNGTAWYAHQYSQGLKISFLGDAKIIGFDLTENWADFPGDSEIVVTGKSAQGFGLLAYEVHYRTAPRAAGQTPQFQTFTIDDPWFQDHYVRTLSISSPNGFAIDNIRYSPPSPDTIPGDVNADGRVDLSDFGIVKANFGPGATWEEGDLDGNGAVDLMDFGIVKANFGKHGRAVAPEPATLALLALGVAIAACGRIAPRKMKKDRGDSAQSVRRSLAYWVDKSMIADSGASLSRFELKVRMVNVVVRNPFNLTPSQILAFGRLDGLTNGSRLPAAKLVGDAIDRGLEPRQAIEHVRADCPRLFMREWSGYWSEDGENFAPRR